MSRLSDLYKAIETLRKENLSTDELESMVELAEEEIIKNEILPIVTKGIAPALEQVQRELVLVVDYVPGRPMSVHLSRKRNFTADILDAKEIKVDEAVEHGTHKGMRGVKKGPRTSLFVGFPDGTLINEHTAVDTMIVFIKRIGVERVRKVVEDYGQTFCRVPIISNRRDSKYGRKQHSLGGGWLLCTHSNNMEKKRFFEKVSDILGLELEVEVI